VRELRLRVHLEDAVAELFEFGDALDEDLLVGGTVACTGKPLSQFITSSYIFFHLIHFVGVCVF